MKHDSIFRRLLSLLLVLTLVLPCFPIRSRTAEVEPDPTPEASAPATEPEQQDTFFDRIKLYANGEETAAVELSTAEHLTLNAVFDLGEAAITTLTWQIYNPGDSQWVPIFGADSTQLQVGAALLSGMTDGQGRAILNCKITSGSALYYSHSIQIRLVEQADSPAPRSSRSARGGSLQLRLDDDEIIGGELHTHTVTVEYQKLDGTSVAQSYTATVKHGGSLTVNPHSPTVVGYTPYVIHVNGDPTQPFLTQDATFNGDAVKEAFASGGSVYYGVETQNLSINLTNITENYTYRVVYLPNKVTYTVSHYVQNISNDDYILYSVESLPGYVGEMTDATDLTADGQPLSQGFIPLKPFKNQEIAADGTTQINTYYDRQYFLITFKLDGGYGTEPVYARYGAPTHFEEPTRTGYEFVGWVKLQMENATATYSSPRPVTDANGNYIYLLTDNVGVVQMDGTRFKTLRRDPDGKFYSNEDNTEYKPLSNEVLQTRHAQIPGFHMAMLAVWKEKDAEYSVIYWLEKPDHGNTGNLTEDDYDYWESTVLKGDTNASLLDSEYLEEVHSGGLKKAAVVTTYEAVNLDTVDVTALDGKSFLLYYESQGVILTPNQDGNDLQIGSFVSGTAEQHYEWTFIKAGNENNTYYLKCGNNYLNVPDSGQLAVTPFEEDATVFTVAKTNSGITLRGNNSYVQYQNIGSWYAAHYVFTTAGNQPTSFELHTYTHQIPDPELDFYELDYSDLVARDSTRKDITISADGKTVINVYYQRKEYNLRFFYGRTDSNGQEQYWYTTVSRFYSTNYTLLGALNTPDGWGSWTTLPSGTTFDSLLKIPEGAAIKTGSLKNGNYEYLYFTFTAKYGQDIEKLWPADFLQDIPGVKGAFASWAGEGWVYYSQTYSNKTIKGLYTTLDYQLLYSSSYGTKDGIHYSDIGTDKAQENDRYIDFISYFESGHPGQYIYYLWKEISADSISTNDNQLTELPKFTYSSAEGEKFGATETNTVFLDKTSRKCYRLYRIVNTAEDSQNPPNHQTPPDLSSYEFRDAELFASLAEWDISNYFYENTAYNETSYIKSCSLHFFYDAAKYTVTLQSWNHVKDLPGIPYGSMDAANRIKAEYTPEIMMNQYYPQDLPEGAYVFGGWYKTPEYLPGTEARLNTAMPNYNIILFAKWVPRKFDVQVYQTSDRDKLVYYQGTGENLPMQSLAQYTEIRNLNYTGQVLYLPVETTDATMGKDYGTLLPEVVRPAGPDTTHGPLNSETGLYEPATIPENMSPLDVENGLGDIRADWIFVCWAYMEDGVEHAIDVGSYQVHSNVQIYAKWTAKGIIDYRVDYVEADVEIVSETDSQGAVYDVIYARRPRLDANGSPVLDTNGDPVFMVNPSPAPNTNPLLWPMTFNDSGMLCYAAEPTQQWFPMARSQDGNTLRVADSVSGKVNEGANRTFNAKTGNELFDLSSTGGKNYQVGYFPIHVSHTTLMQYGELCGCAGDLLVGQCETHPLVTTFYYIPLKNVNYTVYYLDGNGNPMADANGDGEIDRKDIDGKYVLNPAPGNGSTLQMVVTENYIYNADATPDALQKTLVLSANPEANKITFLYTHTPGSPYKVTHYVETLSDVCDYTDPHTGRHYNLYYTEDGHLLEDDDGNLPSLSVNLVSVPGYEYDRHISYIYDQWNDTDDLPSATGPHSPVKLHEKKKTGVALNQLQDALGNIAASITQDANGNISIKCSDQKHGSHLLKDNLYYYVQGTGENQVKYEVRDIQIVSQDNYTVTYYEPQTGFPLDGPGKYGTEVDIFYDLKYYPYFVYHRVHGTDEILETIMGKALFQKQVTGSSWTETELINKDKPGYTVDSEDKTITMTMTMTIRDNNALQNINTMNFYYYEKSIQFKYVTMVLTNPGSDFRDWKAIVLDDPNARLSTTQQAVNASTGTPFTSQPIINNNAYRFLGWFYDENCKEAVISDSTLMKYLSDGSNQKPNTKIENFELEANRNTLAQYTVIQPQKFVGKYEYMDYAVDQDGTPKVDSDGNPYKEKKSADLTGEGVYVGEHNGVIHTNDRTFYALFLPMLGEITIKRENMGANAGLAAEKYNQANSFVYQITGGPTDKQISMEVTIDPGQSSVTVSNLPFGTYTVTQCNEWSWRYSDVSQTVIISDDAPFADPIFDQEMASNHWLSGFSEVLENIFVEITTP